MLLRDGLEGRVVRSGTFNWIRDLYGYMEDIAFPAGPPTTEKDEDIGSRTKRSIYVVRYEYE